MSVKRFRSLASFDDALLNTAPLRPRETRVPKKSARYITVSSSSVIYSILVDRYRFGVFDEDLAASHLVLVDVHADRLQHMLDALSWVAVPPRPRLRRQDRVAE